MLDAFLPEPRLVEVDHVDLDVPPDRAYEVGRHLDAGRSTIVRALFTLRTLPDRLAGRTSEPPHLRLDDFGTDGGFRVLEDEPGVSFAVGAIGRFWEPAIPFADVAPEDFATFREPGFAKVAWEMRFEPLPEARTRVILTLHLDATDEASWKSVRRYFHVIGPFSRLIRRLVLGMLEDELGTREAAERTIPLLGDELLPHAHSTARDVGEGLVGALGILADLATPFLRGRRSHWGLAAETANRRYPGDDLIPSPTWGWTHGIEIDAPAERVWPWIAQLGQDKAGLYSYQWLENLAGCDIQNADRIHPAWTHPKVGDPLKLHPSASPMSIVAVEPGGFLLAHAANTPRPRAPSDGVAGVAVTWLFQVEPLGQDRCRLVSRYRCSCGDDLATRLAYGPTLIESIGFVMDRRMLLGVKERAEKTA